jgi:hypothetical protein
MMDPAPVENCMGSMSAEEEGDALFRAACRGVGLDDSDTDDGRGLADSDEEDGRGEHTNDTSPSPESGKETQVEGKAGLGFRV